MAVSIAPYRNPSRFQHPLKPVDFCGVAAYVRQKRVTYRFRYVIRAGLRERAQPQGVAIHSAAYNTGTLLIVESSLLISAGLNVRQQFPMTPVEFQNSATAPDLAFYAARWYSLMRPPRTVRRWIRALERSATG